MPIEIVAIGNEILRGQIVNTNAADLSRRLTDAGWSVAHQTTLSDDTALLKQGLREAIERHPIVIATGGLGPTLDDTTLSCARDLFSQSPQPIPNPVGTALGWILKHGNRVLILLPGISQEMRAMFEETVLPYLRTHFPPDQVLFSSAVHFYLQRENEVDPLLRQLQSKYSLEFGIYPSYGVLTVIIRGADKKQVEFAREEIAQRFRQQLLPSGKLEEALHLWMQEHRRTLAFAESCTGGFMASQITALPGASRYFLGSLVTYSNRLKVSLLGVSPQILHKEGAVSRATVQEMWDGLMEKTGADYGIAVSGIAGPTGGTFQKPVGTVWYALGGKGTPPQIDTLYFKGDRQTVILRTTKWLFALLWKYLQEQK